MILAALVSVSAFANERHFSNTYETQVLPAGKAEIEPWLTAYEAAGGGLAVDHRLEFEGGVSDRLMTALYVNFGGDPSGMSYQGVASEWKLNLASRAVKSWGLALYGEVGLAPHEEAFEAKLLLDKETEHLLAAINVVAEVELEHVAGEVEPELVGELVGALAWRPSPVSSLGIEVIEENVVEGGEFEGVELAVGPSASWASTGWWVAAGAPMALPLEGGAVTPKVRVLLGFAL